jgi:hypothetical protein
MPFEDLKPRDPVLELLKKAKDNYNNRSIEQPQMETGFSNQPIVEPKEQAVEMQKEGKPILIPDDWTIDLTEGIDKNLSKEEHNTIITNKIERLKTAFPQLEYIDKGNIKNLKVPKGNKKLSEALYRYLKNIPQEGSSPYLNKGKEISTDEITVESEAPYTKGLAETFLQPQLDVLKGENIGESVKNYFSNAVDYIKEAYKIDALSSPTKLGENVIGSFQSLGNQFNELGSKINKGLNGDYVELTNGLFGIAMSPFEVAKTIAGTIPGGKIVYDYMMKEPDLAGTLITNLVEEISPNLDPKYKELLINLGVIATLTAKGKAEKFKFENKLDKLSQDDIQRFINETQKEIQEKYDPVLKIEKEIEGLKTEAQNKKTTTERKLEINDLIEQKEAKKWDMQNPELSALNKSLESAREKLNKTIDVEASKKEGKLVKYADQIKDDIENGIAQEQAKNVKIKTPKQLATDEILKEFEGQEKLKDEYTQEVNSILTNEPLELTDYFESLSKSVKDDLKTAKTENLLNTLETETVKLKEDLVNAKPEEVEAKLSEIKKKEKIKEDVKQILKPEEVANATKEGKVKDDNSPQYTETDRGGIPPETSSSNRTEQGTKTQEVKIKPEGKDLNVNGTLIPFESLKIWDNVKANTELFKEVSRIGLEKVKTVGKKYIDWAREMIKTVGDWVKPFLKNIWEEVNKPIPAVEKLQSEGIDVNTQGFSLKKKQKSFDDFIVENLGKMKSSEMKSAYEDYLKNPEKQVESGKPRPIDVVRNVTTKKDKGFNIRQRIKFETQNALEPFERYEKILRKDKVPLNEMPSVLADERTRQSTIVANWITGKESPIIGKDGNYTFSPATSFKLAKLIEGKEKDFGNLLVARKTLSDMKLVERLNKEINELSKQEQTPEIKELISQKLSEVDRISDILETNNFDVSPDGTYLTKTGKKKVDIEAKKYQEPIKVYDEINQNLITVAENTGLISKERANELRQSKDYASFQRDLSDIQESYVSQNPAVKLSSQKQRTGSERLDILDPVFNQKNAIIETISKGYNNNIWNSLIKASEKEPILKERFREVKEPNQNTITVKVDGKDKYYQASPEFLAVAKVLSPKQMELWQKLLPLPAKLFQRFTTSANPLFMLGNVPVDQITKLAQTKVGSNPIDFFTDVAKLLSKNPEQLANWERYKKLGGERQVFAHSLEANPEAFTKKLVMDETKWDKILNVTDESIGIVELPSNYSEMISRFAEFNRAKKRGMTDREAMYLAGEVTVPFQRKGNWGGQGGQAFINSLPYFNASIQVLAKSLKTLKEQPLRMSTVTAGLLASGIITSLATMEYATEEQKRKLGQMPASLLARSIYVPSFDGKHFVRIRVPEQMGAITAMFQITAFNFYKYRKSGIKDYLDIANQFIPNRLDVSDPTATPFNLLPQGLKQGIELISNTKTFPKLSPIVPEYMRNLPPEERYTEYTSRVAKSIGGILGMSPIQVDYVLKNIGGSLIGDLTGLPESYERKLGLGEQGDYSILSGQIYDDFYNLREEYTQRNSIAKENDSDYKDVTYKNKIYNHLGEEISDLRKIAKKEKTLPENLQRQVFDLLYDIENKNVDNVANELEKLSANIEPYRKGITTRNVQFKKSNLQEKKKK